MQKAGRPRALAGGEGPQKDLRISVMLRDIRQSRGRYEGKQNRQRKKGITRQRSSLRGPYSARGPLWNKRKIGVEGGYRKTESDALDYLSCLLQEVNCFGEPRNDRQKNKVNRGTGKDRVPRDAPSGRFQE